MLDIYYIQEFQNIGSHTGVMESLKIIETCKLLDDKLINNLSEVDLRGGRDILVRFASFEYPLILGRGNEVRKMLYFERIWSYLRGKNLNNEIQYLDLRFDKHVFIGLSENIAEKENRI